MSVVTARICSASTAARMPRACSGDDVSRYRIYGLEPGEYIVATEGWHIVTTTFDGDPKTASVTRPAERLGFATTFHPSVASDSAALRDSVRRWRDASGIDILVARAHLVDVQVPCSTPRRPGLGDQRTAQPEHPVQRRVRPFPHRCGRTLSGARARPWELPAAVGRGGAVNGRVEYADLPLSVAGTSKAWSYRRSPASPCRAGSCWRRVSRSTPARCGSRSSAAEWPCGPSKRSPQSTTTGAFGRRMCSDRTWFAWVYHPAGPSEP